MTNAASNATPVSPDIGLSPPVDVAGEPLDIIFIDGYIGQTVIGIHDSELHHTQPVRVDLRAGVPRAGACRSDRIADTIDYGVVRERLHELFESHRFRLLEAFAEAIATLLIDDFGAAWVRVKVAKPHKFEDVEAVGVLIERRAAEPTPGGAPRAATVLQLIGAGMVPDPRRG